MPKGLLNTLPPAPAGKTGFPWTEETDPAIYDQEFNWPKISIVTPSFNQAEFLEETIRSILLQNYPRLEYFVMDGGSTDHSSGIIQKYEPWIKYWVSEKDRGQSHAINKGLERSSGELFNWINSDDSLVKDSLAVVGKYYGSNDQFGLIKGRCRTYNVTQKLTQDLDHIHEGREYRALFGAANNHQPATFMKMEGIKSLNGVDEHRHFGMDMDLMVGISLQYATIEIPELIAKASLHDSSKTASQGERFAKDWSANFSKLLRTFPEQSGSVTSKMKALGLYVEGEDRYKTNHLVNEELLEGGFKYFLLSLSVFLYAGGAAKRARTIYTYLLRNYRHFYLYRKLYKQHLLTSSPAQVMIKWRRKYRAAKTSNQ